MQLWRLAIAVVSRFPYPFGLEWMEGGILAHALRIAEGQPTYAAPSVDFIPFLYTPLYPMVEEDPLQFAHAKLGMLLFYSWSAFGPKGILWDSVDGVDRNLLYPAIRAISETPVGLARGTLEKTYDNLTYADVLEVSGSIVD